MKRNDDVFFFTLVDFLLQVFFFGLLLYVVSAVAAKAKEAKVNDNAAKIEQTQAQIKRIESWTGFSSITELTDYLSNLAPPQDFRGWADFMSKHKDVKPVASAIEYIQDKGGIATVKANLQKFEDAYGLPPCYFTESADGKISPRAVATLLVEDTKISLSQSSSEFDALISSSGIQFGIGQSMNLEVFSKTFAQFKQAGRKCNVHVVVNLRTDLNRPYFSALSGFAPLRVIR